MYETYYQLKTKPFTLLPDPEFLYLGSRHKMALSSLEYGLASGSAFMLITGDPGTGKTTLLNRLLDHSGHPWTIGMVSNVHSGLSGLMPWIAAAFGLQINDKNQVDVFHDFSRFLEREQSAGRRVLLVLDEAQNVGATMLEELRLLSNLNDGRRRSLQILLSGQSGLRDLLVGSRMVQLAQRIGVESMLDGLSEDETSAYIGHRLQVAGRQAPLFSPLAGRIVFRLTGGLPRLVNQVCDHALVYGYAEQVDRITARIVLNAAAARARLGVLPLAISPGDVQLSQQELTTEQVEAATCKAGYSPRVDQSRGHSHRGLIQDPASVYRKGLTLKEDGDYMKAVSFFERLIDQESWAVKALAQKGLCLKAVGRHDDALTVIREASTRRSATEDESKAVRYLLARTLESQGLFGEARQIYTVLNQEQQKYRDVATRLARLNDSQTDEPFTVDLPVSKLSAFWRGCGQLLRGLQG